MRDPVTASRAERARDQHGQPVGSVRRRELRNNFTRREDIGSRGSLAALIQQQDTNE